MHSTLKPRESDPHDVFAIEPDIVPLAWADKVLADIASGGEGQPSDQPPLAASGAAAAAPAVDTTFRATAVEDLQIANDRAADPPATPKWAKTAVMLVLTLCSAAAAAGWQHYGDTAKQVISNWTPAFAQSSSPEAAGLAAQAGTPAVQAAATDPAAPPNATQSPERAAPAAAAPASDTAQLQSMARDLAAMAQQIVELKASLAELKAGQQAMARPSDARTSEAKPSEAKPSEAKPSEVRPAAPNPRPKISAPPQRSAAAPAHRPMPAYAPAPTAAPPPPLAAPPPVAWQPAPPPQAATEPDGEPVVRPPMPLR